MSSSDLSDVESVVNSIKGFQFEPMKNPEYFDDEGWETYDDEEDDDQEECAERKEKKIVSEWCTCGRCSEMPTEKECVCCRELQGIAFFDIEGLTCITRHENFKAVVLLKDNLWTALVGMHDRESAYLPPRHQVPSRCYRYAAYRQFTWWIHNRLGKGVRRVIPSCVVQEIRHTFPSVDGCYSGYSDGKMVDEREFSWTFRMEDEKLD